MVSCENIQKWYYYRMKGERTDKQRVGAVGEDIACRFLMKRGFSIMDRNYLKKWGEIDVIARKGKMVHFVEVKTVSCEKDGDVMNPFENIHTHKIERLHRTMQSYLLENNIDDEMWQLDGIAVRLDVKAREASVEVIENIIGE